MNRYTIDRDQDDKIALLYRLGKSTYQIADGLGLDRNTVKGALRRTNTPTRSISEAMKLRREMA